MEIAITKAELRINMKAREWCKLSYPDHPHGCPNYGDSKHPQCPPIAPFIQDYIDLTKQMYLIVIEFDFAGHVAKFKQKGWTDRQARCVLYWQNGVNKQLENACTLFKWSHPGMVTTRCPEAMGVNVIASALQIGIPIKIKPVEKVYKIALGGYPSRGGT